MESCLSSCAGSSSNGARRVGDCSARSPILLGLVAAHNRLPRCSPAPRRRRPRLPPGKLPPVRNSRPSAHRGTRFVTPDGRTFQWRGITAFRLVDYVADGQEAQAERYLAWAASQGLTVVRVLTMMAGQFDLRPEDGRRALPRVLELASKHGLYVEVVALAGTADIPVNLQEHVEEIGKILAAHPNGLLEIANEPVHPSQSADVQQAGGA